MTETKQPEALRLAETLEALGDYNFATEAAAELRRQHAEIEALRAKLEQATVALKDISNDNWPDAGINAGEYACLVLHELAAGARPVEPAPAAQDDAKDAARYRWLRDPTTDVALVLDKRTGYVPADEQVPGVGYYYTYEYRAGIELDAAIDSALAADKKEPTNGND